MEPIREALTYDDVLLLPGFASFAPQDIDTKTQFSRNITLNAPLCSSPMDMVTRHKLAIEMALCGGIGIMDRNMKIEEQCAEVAKVKRHMSTVITCPCTLFPHDTVATARNLMRTKEISGIPITNAEYRLVGMFTRHDLRFIPSDDTLLSDVMTTENLITASHDASYEEVSRLFREKHVEKIPLVDENFVLKGLMTLRDIEKKHLFPRATLDTRGQLRVGAAVGSMKDFFERATDLVHAGTDVIVIDSAHGHSVNVVNALIALKKLSVDIVAGNVATAQGARVLCQHGADGIKVGIGPGSICTTRVVTGVGVPQISAIMRAVEGVGDHVPIIADGGIKYSGDITKAIAAGASCVMIGSLFAGTEESPGEKIISGGRLYKSYRGMGSQAVIESGGDRYGLKAVPEGIEGKVSYKGPLSLVFEQLVGGLLQGMRYTGSRCIEDLQKRVNTGFIRVTHAGLVESHPHDVLITNEAPNYQTTT